MHIHDDIDIKMVEKLIKKREYAKRYYCDNKSKVKQWHYTYNKNNPEKIVAIRKAYLDRNKVKIKESRAKYWKLYKERLKKIDCL